MATYYVGPVAAGLADGSSWANRYGSLNDAEDTPVVAGDTVYVGAGVYRETLTVDVSGGAGTEIVYIGDVTGENTDGVGGIVRITGSDNDQVPLRNNCISANTKDYRTFRGFHCDLANTHGIDFTDCQYWIIEDCYIVEIDQNGINVAGASQSNVTIRRCFLGMAASGRPLLQFGHAVAVDNTNHLVENCLFVGVPINGYGIRPDKVGGITIRNSSFIGSSRAVYSDGVLTGGQINVVNNCIFVSCRVAVKATNLGELIENFNTFYLNQTDRTNVAVGVNSVTYPPIFNSPVLFDGIKFPWWFGELSEWSQVRRIAGTAEAANDLHGMTRPVTSAKNSWGAVQFVDAEYETGTVQAGSVGRVLNDAGVRFVRRIATTNVATTVTLFLRRETNYAGGVPRMIIRQPGQADRTTDMTAAVDTWEQLSDTFTPATLPGYVDVLVESRNTAAAGIYAVFYDTMDVT